MSGVGCQQVDKLLELQSVFANLPVIENIDDAVQTIIQSPFFTEATMVSLINQLVYISFGCRDKKRAIELTQKLLSYPVFKGTFWSAMVSEESAMGCTFRIEFVRACVDAGIVQVEDAISVLIDTDKNSSDSKKSSAQRLFMAIAPEIQKISPRLFSRFSEQIQMQKELPNSRLTIAAKIFNELQADDWLLYRQLWNGECFDAFEDILRVDDVEYLNDFVTSGYFNYEYTSSHWLYGRETILDTAIRLGAVKSAAFLCQMLPSLRISPLIGMHKELALFICEKYPTQISAVVNGAIICHRNDVLKSVLLHHFDRQASDTLQEAVVSWYKSCVAAHNLSALMLLIDLGVVINDISILDACLESTLLSGEIQMAFVMAGSNRRTDSFAKNVEHLLHSWIEIGKEPEPIFPIELGDKWTITRDDAMRACERGSSQLCAKIAANEAVELEIRALVLDSVYRNRDDAPMKAMLKESGSIDAKLHCYLLNMAALTQDIAAFDRMRESLNARLPDTRVSFFLTSWSTPHRR